MPYEYPPAVQKTSTEFITDKQLSIIVPYRDRPEHLRVFSKQLLKYFKHDKEDHKIPLTVTVVEQQPDTPFNAGMLKNIGAHITGKADYFCFHDVDYLPVWADYSYATMPTRIVWQGAHVRPYAPGGEIGAIHVRETFWGGVVAVNKADLIRANGYSNEYWGWGSEDDDFRNRLEVEGCTIEHRDGYFQPLEHENSGHTPSGEPKPVGIRNHALREKKLAGMIRRAEHKKDGLNTVKYKVLDVYKRRARLKPEDCPPNLIEWQHVKVDFAAPTKLG